MTLYWIGADPGGKGKFGLAFLDSCGCLDTTQVVGSVDEACEVIFEKCKKHEPLGLGIDAPMWWSSVEGAGRRSDQLLRDKWKIPSGTVQTANSLQGAALVGGAMLAFRIREEFPGVRITEAHPKALVYVPGYNLEELTADHKIPFTTLGNENEDKRDAAIAALAAREGFEGSWTTDLARCRDSSELDPKTFWLRPVHYWWPEPVDNE